MGNYVVWCPRYGQDRDHGERVAADGRREAATEWARLHDQRSAEYAIASGRDVEVCVYDERSGAVTHWTVTGEAVPTYWARYVPPNAGNEGPPKATGLGRNDRALLSAALASNGGGIDSERYPEASRKRLMKTGLLKWKPNQHKSFHYAKLMTLTDHGVKVAIGLRHGENMTNEATGVGAVALNSLLDRMRLLEKDHAPDGWPAVQMRDISALCSEVERLQRDCAEAYQVVGAVTFGDPPLYTDDDACRALDNLSAAAAGEPRPHDDLLPWPLPPNDGVKP